MATVVAIYYRWPEGTAALDRFAEWGEKGGVLTAAIAASLAGGALSEASIVYFRNRGRWTRHHLENLGFKLAMFFVSGGITYQFYRLQGYCFGQGMAWSVLLPKLLVDQFLYTPFWSVPYQTLLTRWQVLHFSGRRLKAELGRDFVVERILPVLVTSWMFWIPGVLFVYSMPAHLQMALAIFATASWGILLAAVTRPIHAGDQAVHPLIVAAPEVLADSDEE